MEAQVKNLTARMPSDLWDWFKDRAKQSSRSANSQLIADLRKLKEQEGDEQKAKP